MDSARLIGRVEPVRRALRRLVIAMGAARWAAAAIGAVVVGVGADYLLNLGAWPRLALGMAVAGGVAWCAYRWVWGAVKERVELAAVAQALESAVPEARGRLASAVGFAAGQDGTSAEGLRSAAIASAEAAVAGKSLRSVVDVGPLMRWAVVAAAMAGMGIGLGAWMGAEWRAIAWQRWASPFGGVRWPQTTVVELAGAVPTKVAWGDAFTVAAKLSRGDASGKIVRVKVRLEASAGGGVIESEQLLSRRADGVYEAQIETGRPPSEWGSGTAMVSGKMTLRVESGDGMAEVPPVMVAARAAVVAAKVSMTLPEYAGPAPAVEADLLRGPMLVVEGSRVGLDLQMSKPVAPGVAWAGGKADGALPPVAPGISGDGRHVTAAWVAVGGASSTFGLTGTDADGLAVRVSQPMEVTVMPDAVPTVQLTAPISALQLTAEADLELAAEARDDLGVRRLDAMVFPAGGGGGGGAIGANRVPLWRGKGAERVGADDVKAVVEAAPNGADAARVGVSLRRPVMKWLGVASAPPSGSMFDLAAGVTDNFSRVRDGKTETHPEVTSSRIRLTIISQEQLARQAAEEMRQTAAALSRVLADHQAMGSQLGDLADSLGNRAPDAADRQQLARMSEQLSSTAAAARSMSEKMSALSGRLAANRSNREDLKASAADAAALLGTAGTETLVRSQKMAREAAGDGAEAKEAAGRAKSAADEAKAGADAMAAALSRLGSGDGLAEAMASAKALAEAQKALTEQTRAAEAAARAGDKATAAALAQKQADIGSRAQALLEAMSQQAQQPTTDPTVKQGLTAAANAAREKQLLGNAAAAAKALAGGQAAEAAPGQQGVSEALSGMMEQLQKAQAELAKQLSRQLAEVKQQLDALIIRQASHNAGVLTLLGRWKADTAEYQATFPHLEPDFKPAADGATIAADQKQTHRNTVDLARSLGAKAGMAEVSAKLLRVGGSMERAAAYLAAGQLAEAYQPPQARSLEELVRLSADVAKQMEKDKEAGEKKKREQLRALFEALKTRQQEVLTQVAKVDGGRAANGGALTRQERLDVLPGLANRQRQIGLSLRQTEDRLKELNSMVYLWLNGKLQEESSAAQAGLTDLKTDAAVQERQGRIISLIDAMIEALQIVPLPKDFSEKAGAGGGGGGGGSSQVKPMPQEAELRLVREVQRQINTATAKSAAGDAARAGELAARQADLRKTLTDLFVKSKRPGFEPMAEPDPAATLAEDTRPGAAEDADLDAQLLKGKPEDEQVDDAAAAALTKMAMVRQRLALRADVGQQTQRLQRGVMSALDLLVEQARKNPGNCQGGSPKDDDVGLKQKSEPSQSSSKPGPQAGGPKAGQNGAMRPGSASGSGARKEASAGGDYQAGPGGASTPLAEVMKEWGTITPRQRQAIIEGASDQMIERYRAEIEAYYRSLGAGAGAGGGGGGGGGGKP